MDALGVLGTKILACCSNCSSSGAVWPKVADALLVPKSEWGEWIPVIIV